MRFAYVAAGAVVLGATVSEARSVPSSPHRLSKVAKRQSRVIPIDPFTLGSSSLPKTGQAIPAEVQDRSDDGIDGTQMLQPGLDAEGESLTSTQLSNQDRLNNSQDPIVQALESMMAVKTHPESPVSLPGASTPEGPARPNVINVNHGGVPEYVIINSPQSQGERPSAVPGTPRRYIPVQLARPVYTVEREAPTETLAATQPFESAYPLIFNAGHATDLPNSQAQSTPQGVPISTGTPSSLMATILEELKLAQDQSISPNQPTGSTVLPPPVLRALGGIEMPVNPSKKIASSDNQTKSTQKSAALTENLERTSNGSSPPPAPLATFQKLQLSNDTAPLLVNGTFASASFNSTMEGSERAALPTGNTSIPVDTTTPPLNLNTTMGDNERVLLPTDVGSNETTGSVGNSLSGNGQVSMSLNASVLTESSNSSSNIPLNTTINPISSTLPAQIEKVATQE